MQTPTSPVNLACAQAINAAISSCRTCTKSIATSARSHYDFSGGVRGNYAARYAEGTNMIVLAPDVTAMFPGSVAVNDDSRTLVRKSAKTVRAKAAPKKRVR
jgi:hypothetical protein